MLFAYRCTHQCHSTLIRRPALQVNFSALSPFLSLTIAPAAPEVTEGPYYLVNDLVRQDVRENQGGIPLRLDIGVMDTSTCKPLPNVLVEIWHANATGYYSSVASASMKRRSDQYPLLNSGFGTGATSGGGGGSNSSSSAANGPPSGSAPSGASMSQGAAPSGSGMVGGGGGSSKNNEENFLRGGWQTNDNGLVEFLTVYPGFCK